MSSTPRLRSGFPGTPGPVARQRQNKVQDTPASASSVSSAGGSTRSPTRTLPLAPENAQPNPESQPVIPLTVLDGPQQRSYAVLVYLLLWGWKGYDWLQVVEDGDSSWWLFLKWILIDFAFLYGLPELRIPWLELSQLAVTSTFLTHLVINYMMMFNIPVRYLPMRQGSPSMETDRQHLYSSRGSRSSLVLLKSFTIANYLFPSKTSESRTY